MLAHMEEKEKLELIADFYEFTMSNGYFTKNKDEIAYFDVFNNRVTIITIES